MASYPKDRFDTLPDDLVRVGAHRGPEKRGGGWVGFAWAALATLVLILGGLFFLNRYVGLDLGLPFLEPGIVSTPTPTPTPTAEPVTDPATIDPARGINIDVLNGTPIVALQDVVAGQLVGLGWSVGSATPADEKSVEKTVIYYSDPANEDVARGVALALGNVEIRLVSPETFPGAPITVVIGSDFPVPAE
jgi:hypothetical protein